MGCCFSKKHPDDSDVSAGRCKPEECDPPHPPSPGEEKVKEVLSETPNTNVRTEAKPSANVVAVEEQEVLKVKASVDGTVSDIGSCVSFATDERSEEASESSVATSSVAGLDRSPGKPSRKRAVSGELGLSRRGRAVAAYGIQSHSCRASPSPPPRREQRDRSVRRSPSPAAKRPPSEQHRASSLQRKPPVPTRPGSRTSPRRTRDTRPPPPPPPVPRSEEEDSVPVGWDGENSIAHANASPKGDDRSGGGDGDGKESLENPLLKQQALQSPKTCQTVSDASAIFSQSSFVVHQGSETSDLNQQRACHRLPSVPLRVTSEFRHRMLSGLPDPTVSSIQQCFVRNIQAAFLI